MIHSLARKGTKMGKIVFRYKGKEQSFSSCINDLSGDRLTWFDNEPPSIGDSLAWVRGAFKEIRKKAEIISCEGDF